MLYIFVFSYIVILIFLFDINKRSGRNLHIKILFLIFVLIAALSYRMGVDSIRYEENFLRNFANPMSLKDVLSGYESVGGTEPFWLILNRCIYSIFGSFTWLKLAIALFSNSIIFWFFKKYSPAFFTSLLIYSLFYYFDFSFEILREVIAVCFFLIAFDRFLSNDGKKKYLLYYLWIIPALYFHRFAVIAILFPLIQHVKIGKVYFVVLLLAVVSIPFVIPIVESVANLSLINAVISNRLTSLADSDTYGGSSLNIFGYIELFLLYLLPIIILISNNEKDDMFVSFALVFTLILLFKSGAFVILFRINNYLGIPTIIAISTGISNSIYKRNFSCVRISFFKSSAISLLCLFIVVGMQIKNQASSKYFPLYYPYASVIDKKEYPAREKLIYELTSTIIY